MRDLRDAARQALEALDLCRDWPGAYDECSQAITALRAALEQPEQVPKSNWQKLYEAAIDQRNEAVAVNQELLEALKEAEPMLDAMLQNITQHLPEFQRMPALDMVRAAIAKAEGQA